jgi:putative aldouronate transport system substrate-binding protein
MTSFLGKEFAETMKKDLNLKVKVTFVPWDQYWEQKDIMLAAKEPIDLYWDGLPDLSTMVNKKQCMPLDDLIQKYGQDMLKVLPLDHIKGGKINGVTYGIPSTNTPSSGMFQLVCVRQDILEAVGMSEIKTPDDLKLFAEKAKKKFPDMKGGADPIFKPLTRYYADEQYTWVGYGDLVVFGEESHKAYSYFETKAFQDLSKFNRGLSKEGLYNDDVTTKYNERDTRMQTGLYLWVEGSLGKENEIIDAVKKNAPEAKLKSYLLATEKPRYIDAAGGEVICIPNSAPNSEGAMKFLNWLYSSQDNYNLALYGVKGVDYEVKDNRINRLTGDDLFYEWMFRNKSYQMFAPKIDQTFIDQYAHWDDNAKVSKAFGFAFDNKNVKEIETKLNEISGKSFAAIRSGFIDYNTEYPKAVKQLKDAGIDKYVAEIQRQLDEYMVKQK